jgi:REP element-mobilizing transposase RayT
MNDDQNIHHRRSIRLRGYDYTQSGVYFVTICTHARAHIFGQIIDGAVDLSPAGRLLDRCWLALPRHFSFVTIDTYVIMPDHIHGILAIDRPEDHARPAPSTRPHVVPGSLGAIVRTLKSTAARAINRSSGGPIWQRNYYERVVRDDAELQRVRAYIINNPARWRLRY